MNKIFKEINWRYAFGELLLIFLGITIAIWFNNWNEKQKSIKIEVKSISEIKNAINQDLLDINENISGFSKRVELYNQIIYHIERDLPMDESLKKNFQLMQGVTSFFSNTGPYETLKSRGLEIINNDDLRLKISLYYDFECEKILTNERQHYEHYINYMKPLMMKSFNLSNFKLAPLNYHNLIEDFEFKQIIYWALITDSSILELYKDLKKTGKSLVNELDKEIGQID